MQTVEKTQTLEKDGMALKAPSSPGTVWFYGSKMTYLLIQPACPYKCL